MGELYASIGWVLCEYAFRCPEPLWAFRLCGGALAYRLGNWFYGKSLEA